MKKRIWSAFMAIAMIFSLGVVPTTALADDSTVTGVTVDPAEVSVEKGSTKSFSAEVLIEGGTHSNQNVTWSVSDNASGSTNINATGELSVAADETAATLTVIATSDADTDVSGTATVTVTEPAAEPIVTGVTVTPATADVAKGATAEF